MQFVQVISVKLVWLGVVGIKGLKKREGMQKALELNLRSIISL